MGPKKVDKENQCTSLWLNAGSIEERGVRRGWDVGKSWCRQGHISHTNNFSICFQSHKKSVKPKQAVRISFSFHGERRLGGGKNIWKKALGKQLWKMGEEVMPTLTRMFQNMWPLWFSGWASSHALKMLWVVFLVSAHAYVLGSIPGRGCAGGSRFMFLSLSSPLPPSPSKNNQLKNAKYIKSSSISSLSWGKMKSI